MKKKTPSKRLPAPLTPLLGIIFISSLLSGSAMAETEFLCSDPPTHQTLCAGESVLRFGKTWIWQQAPNLQPPITIQDGNSQPQEKVRPQKSSELRSNFLGVNTSGMPRSRVNDYQPCEPVHLIDGDVQSCWMSRGKRRPEMEPSWVRLDFPMEREIQRVVLKKRPKGYVRPNWTKLPLAGCVEVGQGMPLKVRIEATNDGLTWQTLFEGPTNDTPEKTQFAAEFTPVRVRSVRVLALETPYVEQFGYAFSISELEVSDSAGQNAALISAGTGIVASSTEHGRNEIDALRTLWPVHGDSGMKWVRIGYHDDPVNWHEVEKVKGVLEVDPMADESITELARMGLNVILCLDFGNRLYSMPEEAGKERPFPQLWEWYYDSPKPPVTPEALAAWDRYVEFMVLKYRDRVKYFEVWNEWNISLYWGDEVSEEHYLALAKRTIPIIRRLAPDAKILAGSTSGFPHGCRNWKGNEWQNEMRTRVFAELIPLVDVLSWHPYYQPNPESENFLHYAEDVQALKAWARKLGFHGSFMSTEWNFSFNYPEFLEVDQKRLWRGNVSFTEMQKAKYVAQCFVQDSGLGLVSCFCELNNPFYGALDLSLFRRSVDTDPVSTLQPEAAYYVMRNLATMLDGLTPAEWPFQVKLLSENDPSPGTPLRSFTFESPEGPALALWFAGRCADVTPGTPTEVTLPFPVQSITAFEPMNGIRQTVNFTVHENSTRIQGLRVTDVPLILQIRK